MVTQSMEYVALPISVTAILSSGTVVEVSDTSLTGYIFTTIFSTYRTSGLASGNKVALWLSRDANTWSLPQGTQGTKIFHICV